MKKHRAAVLVSALCAILLSSCASGGGQFSEVRNNSALAPKSGKGLVLVYWQPGFAAAALKLYVQMNGAELPVRLARGGFISQEVAPGAVNVSYSLSPGASTPETRSKSLAQNTLYGALSAGPAGLVVGAALSGSEDRRLHRKHGTDVQVQPGVITYVMMEGSPGKLKQVPTEVGEREIQKLRWLNHVGN